MSVDILEEIDFVLSDQRLSELQTILDVVFENPMDEEYSGFVRNVHHYETCDLEDCRQYGIRVEPMFNFTRHDFGTSYEYIAGKTFIAYSPGIQSDGRAYEWYTQEEDWLGQRALAGGM